jgi:hypothetical protein
MTTNPYIEKGRLLKASCISNVLAAHGYKSFTVAEFGPKERELAASAARQRKPSDETWAKVVELLRQREEASRMVGGKK